METAALQEAPMTAAARHAPENRSRWSGQPVAAWLLYLTMGGTQISFNLYHSFHSTHLGSNLLAVLFGTVPVAASWIASHLAARRSADGWIQGGAYAVTLLAMALSIGATATVVGRGPGLWDAIGFGALLDVGSLLALRVILRAARVAEQETGLAAELEGVRAELSAARRAAERQQRESETALSAVRSDAEAALSSARAEAASALESARTEYATQLEAAQGFTAQIRSDAQAGFSTARTEADARVETVRADAEQVISRIRAEASEAIATASAAARAAEDERCRHAEDAALARAELEQFRMRSSARNSRRSSGRNSRRTSAPEAARTSAPGTDDSSAPEVVGSDDLSTEAQALAIISAEPGISGSQLGLRLGKTDRYGRDLMKRLAPSAAGPEGSS